MNISYARLALTTLVLAVAAGCTKQPQSPPEVDYNKLDQAFVLAGQMASLKCLVVSHDGKVLREAYYGTGGPEIPFDMRSVTKSVTGLLIGVAMARGHLDSVDQKLGDFVDTLAYNITPDKTEIRIRHLLTMSGGFEWEELASVSGYNSWVTSPNQVQYILDKPLAAQPGQAFVYNSGALHLLSYIVTRATGTNTAAFAAQNLFLPLGIGSRDWETDKQGFNNGSAGLSLTPYDMVKIGNLVLNRGIYGSDTVIAPGYVDQLVTSKISTGNVIPYGSGYGYGWWCGRGDKGDYAFAMGWGGQFIVVVPGLNLVVVATNEWSGVSSSAAGAQWNNTINLIMTGVVPAFNK